MMHTFAVQTNAHMIQWGSGRKTKHLQLIAQANPSALRSIKPAIVTSVYQGGAFVEIIMMYIPAIERRSGRLGNRSPPSRCPPKTARKTAVFPVSIFPFLRFALAWNGARHPVGGCPWLTRVAVKLTMTK